MTCRRSRSSVVVLTQGATGGLSGGLGGALGGSFGGALGGSLGGESGGSLGGAAGGSLGDGFGLFGGGLDGGGADVVEHGTFFFSHGTGSEHGTRVKRFLRENNASQQRASSVPRSKKQNTLHTARPSLLEMPDETSTSRPTMYCIVLDCNRVHSKCDNETAILVIIILW